MSSAEECGLYDVEGRRAILEDAPVDLMRFGGELSSDVDTAFKMCVGMSIALAAARA